MVAVGVHTGSVLFTCPRPSGMDVARTRARSRSAALHVKQRVVLVIVDQDHSLSGASEIGALESVSAQDVDGVAADAGSLDGSGLLGRCGRDGSSGAEEAEGAEA